MDSNKKLEWFSNLANLPRGIKKLGQVLYDVIGLSATYLFSIWLVVSELSVDAVALGASFVAMSVLGFKYIGVYRAVIRSLGIRLLESIILAQAFAICTLYFLHVFFDIYVGVVFLLLLYLLSVFVTAGGRLAIREIIYLSRPLGRRVLVYGAGIAGVQLVMSIRQDANYDVVGFVDDNKNLQGTQLNGLSVFPSSGLADIVSKRNVSMIVLAIPRATREEMKLILDKVEPLVVVVKTLPKISDLLDGTGSFGNLEEVRIEELLGRERVCPDEDLMRQNISNKVVLVTGAGGSIGSELCRQIVMRSPKKLILVEHSELGLFNIQQELEKDWGSIIISLLSSVTDEKLMQAVMSEQKVDTVYHAAAYKHVPLIEDNPFSAIHNNVFGTNNILSASIKAGVSSFTLVSTDKAVRPTNVMGASKRLAEIICQIASESKQIKTKIALVRFGNVMGSSGSAIPKFKQQIKDGGPVTVTHPEITRYFMLIPEAVELVMQASSLAEGGEAFVLDMGEPVKITDLVQKLIRFSGNIPANHENAHLGSIKIKYIGLRPGEKLYEELLISGDSLVTDHPKIRKINESYPGREIFSEFLEDLKKLCDARDESGLRDILVHKDIGYVNNDKDAVSGNIRQLGKSKNIELTKSYDSSHPFEAQKAAPKQKSSMVPTNQIPTVDTRNAGPDSWQVRLFFKFLHKYFLLTRPLTMGARCVVLNDNGEVLLVKHTYWEGWHIPGGGIGAGESAELAAKREVAEETVYELVGSLKLVGIYHYEKITNRDHVVVFVSNTFRLGGSKINNFEINEAKFHPLKSLPNDLDASSKAWIMAGLDANTSIVGS